MAEMKKALSDMKDGTVRVPYCVVHGELKLTTPDRQSDHRVLRPGSSGVGRGGDDASGWLLTPAMLTQGVGNGNWEVVGLEMLWIWPASVGFSLGYLWRQRPGRDE